MPLKICGIDFAFTTGIAKSTLQENKLVDTSSITFFDKDFQKLKLLKFIDDSNILVAERPLKVYRKSFANAIYGRINWLSHVFPGRLILVHPSTLKTFLSLSTSKPYQNVFTQARSSHEVDAIGLSLLGALTLGYLDNDRRFDTLRYVYKVCL